MNTLRLQKKLGSRFSVRPALADREGKALFIGTPRGYNHFYDLYQAAQNQPNWATFQFTTEEGGNVSKDEIRSATHETR